MRGRPTKYSAALGDRICEMLANGKTLRAICRAPDMPEESAVRGWAQDPKHEFSTQYVRAREVGYLAMADDIIEIADGKGSDVPAVEGEEQISASDQVQRDRLRVDTRKWLLAKALPKIFGEKTEVNVTANHKHSHESESVSTTHQWVAEMLGSSEKGSAKKPLPN